jgi:SAM-dependent methyltransferase
MSTANPFLDPSVVSGLYDSGDRLTQRTGALHRAKIAGRYVPDVIADLAETWSQPARLLDVGCGRGSTTIAVADRLPDAEIIAVDLSPALLAIARDRTAAHSHRVRFPPSRLPRAAGGYRPMRAGGGGLLSLPLATTDCRHRFEDGRLRCHAGSGCSPLVAEPAARAVGANAEATVHM